MSVKGTSAVGLLGELARFFLNSLSLVGWVCEGEVHAPLGFKESSGDTVFSPYSGGCDCLVLWRLLRLSQVKCWHLTVLTHKTTLSCVESIIGGCHLFRRTSGDDLVTEWQLF